MVLSARLRLPAFARAVLVLAGMAAAFSGAEWFCRRRFPPIEPGEKYLRFLLENAKPFFRVEESGGRTLLAQTPSIWKVVVGQSLPLRKAPGVRRLLVVGESSADMLGRELIGRLDGPLPARVEVMDCAVGAGSLEMVRARFDECSAYSPDAVILAFGHNLFYDHRAPAPWLTALRLGVRRSRFLSVPLERLLGRPREFDPERRRRELQEFIGHLGRRGRELDVPVLIVALPSNLWFAPAKMERASMEADYLGAVYLYRSGRRRQAIVAMTRALELHPSALGHFVLGDWLLRQGDAPGARRHLLLARDLDPSRTRASSDVNAALRAAAAAEGMRVFDAERWTSRRAPNGIPGWESFVDNQHVSVALFRLWADECLKRLGWAAGRAPRIEALSSRNALLWAWGMTNNDPTAQSSVIYLAEQRFGPTNPITDADVGAATDDPVQQSRILLFLAEAAWRTGRRGEALEQNELVRRREPRWADPEVQRGLFELESGRPQAAAAFFQEALRKDPAKTDAAFFIRSIGSGPAL
jgi:tetratricopeptide (TPR) repeat protein